jgi:hypothetical protein
MKIILTTDIGSATFPTVVNNDLVNFDLEACNALIRFADESGIRNPSLVPEIVLYHVNEGFYEDSFSLDEGELGNFSFKYVS